MQPSKLVPRTLGLASAVVLAFSGPALSQPAPKKDFVPEVGQSGKDVVWVPTPQALVDQMLNMAKVTAKDYVIDLGSGDGRTVITAAKRGATAHGIEYNPDMVEIAKRAAEKEGVSAKATFVKADIFESDFSKADVITLFLLTDLNIRLRPTLLNLKPGTRIVSNSFDMGDWEPDERAEVKEGCTSWCRALFWLVPAKVEGSWKLPQGELALKQKYQMVTGTLKSGNVITPITDGRLKGDELTFTAAGVRYTGKVAGNKIEGTTGSAKWQATKG